MFNKGFTFSKKKKKDYLCHDSISAIPFFHFSPETIGKAIGRKEKGRGSKKGKVKGTDSGKNNLPVNIWD